MKKKIVIATLVSLLGFTACSDDSGQEPPIVRPAAVRLEGAIGLSTRAVIGEDYNEDLKLSFARADISNVDAPDVAGPWGVYSAVRIGGGGSRPIVFTQTQNYPASGSLYLHGYYPADGDKVVSDAETKKVTFTIDGETDVMATGRFKATNTQQTVTCTFRHLLTQLTFICYSNHADKWGEIKKIEAADIPLRQELDWTAETPVLSGVASLDGSSEKGTLPVQDITYPLVISQVNEGEPIPEEGKGYILLPVTGGLGGPTNALWLNITTTKDGKGGEAETTFRVPVSAEGGFQAGNRHALSLFFTDGIAIEVTRVGVTPWEDEEQPVMPI